MPLPQALTHLCVCPSQSGAGGADTSDFDIHAREGDGDEWTLVGRPAWKHNADELPQFQASGALFSMPESEELTLFEPMVFEKGLRHATAPFIGYGISLLLYGIIGFLRFYDWANAGVAVGCMIAIILEAILGKFFFPKTRGPVMRVLFVLPLCSQVTHDS